MLAKTVRFSKSIIDRAIDIHAILVTGESAQNSVSEPKSTSFIEFLVVY